MPPERRRQWQTTFISTKLSGIEFSVKETSLPFKYIFCVFGFLKIHHDFIHNLYRSMQFCLYLFSSQKYFYELFQQRMIDASKLCLLLQSLLCENLFKWTTLSYKNKIPFFFLFRFPFALLPQRGVSPFIAFLGPLTLIFFF